MILLHQQNAEAGQMLNVIHFLGPGETPKYIPHHWATFGMISRKSNFDFPKVIFDAKFSLSLSLEWKCFHMIDTCE